MIALVIGATGATGKDLVQQLINDAYFTEIRLFVRRSVVYEDPKVKVVMVDFDQLENFSDEISGDILFSCLGTTLKQAGSRENQWEIDFDIPYVFGKIAKKNKVATCVLVSSYGASPDSYVFYSRMKGTLEEALEILNFNHLIIFRPGSLIREGSDRFGEKVSIRLLNCLNAIGLFKRFRPLSTAVLAQKLVKATRQLQHKKEVVELDQIFTY